MNTLSIELTTIAADAKEFCNHQRLENGAVYYQSDVEAMLADLRSDCFEQLSQELPELLANGSDSPKTIDLSFAIRRAKSRLIEVDNDRLYQIAA